MLLNQDQDLLADLSIAICSSYECHTLEWTQECTPQLICECFQYSTEKFLGTIKLFFSNRLQWHQIKHIMVVGEIASQSNPQCDCESLALFVRFHKSQFNCAHLWQNIDIPWRALFTNFTLIRGPIDCLALEVIFAERLEFGERQKADTGSKKKVDTGFKKVDTGSKIF